MLAHYPEKALVWQMFAVPFLLCTFMRVRVSVCLRSEAYKRYILIWG